MQPVISRLALAAVVLGGPAVLHAQQDSTHRPDTTAALIQQARVLDHTFNASSGEPVRVFLAKGIVYQVEIEGTGIQLQLRPVLMSTTLPLIEPLLGGTSATGSTLYRVTPRADGEYEFISTGGDPARPINLHVRAEPEKKP